MKFKVNRENFRKVLNVVKVAQSSGAVNENIWTKGIKIEKETNTSVRLSATNISTTISAVVEDVVIEKDGKMLLGGDILDKITSLQTGEELSVELVDNVAKLVCGNDLSQFEVMRDDFIGIDLSNANKWFSIPTKLFLTADSEVRFAACMDNGTRPKMQSVYFKIDNNTMDIVACDGKKLAKVVLPLDVNTLYNDFCALIRGDIVNKISSALKDLIGSDGIVDICMDNDKMFIIRSGNFLASAQLTDSSYINYKKIIPSTEEISLSISCNKKDLIRKSEMANFANKYSKDSAGIDHIGIKVSEEGFGEGSLSVVSAKAASNKQISEISVTLESGTITPDFCVWVNYKNLSEVLKNFNSEKVIIDFKDSNNPFIIRDKDRTNYITLLMPIPNNKG
jgi:DNA polymerase III sliding clamp (beta) subunit (PCNA family)